MAKDAIEVAEVIDIEIPKRRPKAVRRGNLKLLESTNHFWRLVAERGTTREDLTSSDLHSVVSDQYLANDVIHVVSEDRTFFAMLLVIDAGRGYAQVIELNYVKLPPLLAIGDGIPPGYEIQWSGPDSQYQIIRLCDSVMMHDGFSDRQSALAWLLDHASMR